MNDHHVPFLMLAIGLALGWAIRSVWYETRRYEDDLTWERAVEHTANRMIDRIVKRRYPELFFAQGEESVKDEVGGTTEAQTIRPEAIRGEE